MASPIASFIKSFARKFKFFCSSVATGIIWGLQQNSDKPQNVIEDVWTANQVSEFVEDGVKEVMRLSFQKGVKRDIPVFPEDLSKSWDASGMTLSEKLHGADKEMRQKIVDTVKSQLKQSNHAMQAARELYDGYNSGKKVVRQQQLPKYLDEIVAFARRSYLTDSEKQELLRKVRKAQRQVDRLGANGAPNKALKASYSELLQAVQDGSEKALSRAVHTAVEEKSRYVAERIARTEAARAWADGFLEKYQNDDMVVAYRWELSSRHPHYDICDLYANADLWGLGAGIYPKDHTPNLPVHPHCLCHLSPVYDGEIKGRARNQIEGGGRKYLFKQSLQHRQQILGIQGNKAVSNQDSWTKWARNYSGKFLQPREIKVLDASLQPYLHDGKIKIADIAKRNDGESKADLKKRVRAYIASEYCTKEFTDRQRIHIKGTNIYNPTKSYYDSEKTLPIETVRKLISNMDILTTGKGDWNQRGLIHHKGIIAHWVSQKGGGETEYSVVHFGDAGIHTVPTKPPKERS